MKIRHAVAFAIILASLVLPGCSYHSSNPVLPIGDRPLVVSRNTDKISNTLLWGLYDVMLDVDSMAIDWVVDRTAMFTANVVAFINNTPAGLSFSNFSVTPHDTSVDVDLDVRITHPLSSSGFDGYDVRGVFIGDGGAMSTWDNVLYPLPDTDQILVNADGLTRWFNPTEFMTPGLFGYTEGKFASNGYIGSATVNQYKYFAEGLGAGDDLWDYLLSAPTDAGSFLAGTSNTRTYSLNFPQPDPGIKFNYAIIADWSGTDAIDHPSHTAETVACDINVTPDLFYVSDDYRGGSLILDVAIYNWADVITDSVAEIVIDSTVLSDPYQLVLSTATPVDQGDNWAQYHLEILADNVTGTDGNSFMLIVPQLNENYDNQFGVDNDAVGPLSAYFFKQLEVADTPYNVNLPGDVPIDIELINDSLTFPVNVTGAGDGSGRLFVVEKAGKIRIVDNGTLLTDPFLDISSLVETGGNEQGLLGLAFEPDYSNNGFFYIDYTATASSGGTVIARYQVSADPNLADPGSAKEILAFQQPYPNHNGGKLIFGTNDGYLYITTGDGGSAGDPQGNAQNGDAYLGKILRIDVDVDPEPYIIPPDNPFVGNADFLDEIWAYGLRNPWQISFDTKTADLYIADVGQGNWEEVDFQPASSPGGENFGWNIMEGNHCYPSDPCDSTGLVLPITEYGHVDGNCSITGLGVYRADEYPALDGIYFFADYCSGRIWGAARDSVGSWVAEELLDTSLQITGAGVDENGDVYFTTASGELYKITG
jgi:glucose/arabinose dehydrogenase